MQLNDEEIQRIADELGLSEYELLKQYSLPIEDYKFSSLQQARIAYENDKGFPLLQTCLAMCKSPTDVRDVEPDFELDELRAVIGQTAWVKIKERHLELCVAPKDAESLYESIVEDIRKASSLTAEELNNFSRLEPDGYDLNTAIDYAAVHAATQKLQTPGVEVARGMLPRIVRKWVGVCTVIPELRGVLNFFGATPPSDVRDMVLTQSRNIVMFSRVQD